MILTPSKLSNSLFDPLQTFIDAPAQSVSLEIGALAETTTVTQESSQGSLLGTDPDLFLINFPSEEFKSNGFYDFGTSGFESLGHVSNSGSLKPPANPVGSESRNPNRAPNAMLSTATSGQLSHVPGYFPPPTGPTPGYPLFPAFFQPSRELIDPGLNHKTQITSANSDCNISPALSTAYGVCSSTLEPMREYDHNYSLNLFTDFQTSVSRDSNPSDIPRIFSPVSNKRNHPSANDLDGQLINAPP